MKDLIKFSEGRIILFKYLESLKIQFKDEVLKTVLKSDQF